MPCTSPLKGYQSHEVNPETGKRKIVITGKEHKAPFHDPIQVSCGQCDSCKLKKSRHWAVRAMLEASLYEKNCFITLTYNDEHLPYNSVIDKNAVKKFMMRLRTHYGAGIRSFGCAEYGEKFGRPHYHILLFNHDFPDKYYFRTRRGNPVYRSERLEKLWKYGYSEIGSLTMQSAAYVARYCMKKFTGPEAADHYEVEDMETGELVPVPAESTVAVSRMPGIGKPWLDRFKSDAYPKDYITVQGHKVSPPSYFDYRLEIDDPELFSSIKLKRKERMNEMKPVNLNAEAEIVRARLKQLQRGYENGSQS